MRDYQVVLRRGVDPAKVAAEVRKAFPGTQNIVILAALGGFSARLEDVAAAWLKKDLRVEAIDEEPYLTPAETVQPVTGQWGLDRIDQRALPLDGQYHYAKTGAGVRVYVMDTGVRLTHQDFDGSVLPGPEGTDADIDGHGSNGHGTLVAGIIAGTQHGVAKGATIIPLRTVGENATMGSIAAFDWIIANHPPGSPGVVNMSFTTSGSAVFEAALQRVFEAGIVCVAAAGNNSSSDVTLPARAANVISVGAIMDSDNLNSRSNYGPDVDIFAPAQVSSTSSRSDTATATTSNGTSFAAPHVAGIAALILESVPNPSVPGEVNRLILEQATAGMLGNLQHPESPNLLAYSLVDSPQVVPPTPSSLVLESVTTNSATISWSDVSAPQYQVLRDGVIVGVTSTTTFTDMGLAAGSIRNYTVVASSLAGNSAPSDALAVETLPSTRDRVNASAFTAAISALSVSSWWRFEEGSGSTAFAEVGDHDIALPASASLRVEGLHPASEHGLYKSAELADLGTLGNWGQTSARGMMFWLQLDQPLPDNSFIPLMSGSGGYYFGIGLITTPQEVEAQIAIVDITAEPRLMSINVLEPFLDILSDGEPHSIAWSLDIDTQEGHFWLDGNSLNVDVEVLNDAPPNVGEFTEPVKLEFRGYYDELIFFSQTISQADVDTVLATLSASSLQGDINGDGVVDGLDLSALLSSWGSDEASADINSDGSVDSIDLSILIANWS